MERIFYLNSGRKNFEEELEKINKILQKNNCEVKMMINESVGDAYHGGVYIVIKGNKI